MSVERTEAGVKVLTEAAVHPPPFGPYVHGAAYPIAFDVDGVLGAVSLATWDMYPGLLEAQWWCAVELFARHDGEWDSSGGEHDDLASPIPFQRPRTTWNGAYVAVVADDTATLIGYGADGRRLGAFAIPGDDEPDLGPGWRRVQVSAG